MYIYIFLLGVEAPWSSGSFTIIIQLAQCSGLWGGHLGCIASAIPGCKLEGKTLRTPFCVSCSYGSQGQAEKKVLNLKLEQLPSSRAYCRMGQEASPAELAGERICGHRNSIVKEA